MNKSLIIFGINSITRRFPMDGYLEPDAAIAQARKLMAEGQIGMTSVRHPAIPTPRLFRPMKSARIAPVLERSRQMAFPSRSMIINPRRSLCPVAWCGLSQ